MKNHISASQRLNEKLGDLIARTESGGRLPSEPFLARQLGVSRATLREAMRTFETQGLIRRRQGSGTYVLPPTNIIDSGLEVLESIETLAERIGLSVTMGELKINHRTGTKDELNNLQLAEDGMVMHLSRVIYADKRPVAYLIDIVPDTLLKSDDLSNEFSGSVLDLFLSRGDLDLISSRCEISAETSTPEVARALGIQRGDAILRFEAYLFTTEGRVIDYSFSYFLPGVFRFHVVRKVGR
jgi:GntR family transcriptional regulator